MSQHPHSASVALICAYQPHETLVDIVRSLLGQSSWTAIYLVDDGSGPQFDAPFRKAEDLNPEKIVRITQNPNQGKGMALKAGMRAIRDRFSEHALVVCLDSDGQHHPEDVYRVLKSLMSTPHSIHLGCRTFDRHVPFRNRVGNLLTALLLRLIYASQLTDTQTGLRGFSSRWIRFFLNIPGERFEYETRQLIELIRHQAPLVEVPIRTLYPKDRHAHFHPIKDSYRIYRILVTCFLFPRKIDKSW